MTAVSTRTYGHLVDGSETPADGAAIERRCPADGALVARFAEGLSLIHI